MTAGFLSHLRPSSPLPAALSLVCGCLEIREPTRESQPSSSGLSMHARISRHRFAVEVVDEQIAEISQVRGLDVRSHYG